MTALRFCGGLRLRLTILEPHEVYRVWITDDRGTRYRTTVVAPRCADHALDHPESFDDAAHAALSFADHDRSDLDFMRADMDRVGGWNITRKPQGEEEVQS